MGRSLEEERGGKARGAVAGNGSKNDMRIKGRKGSKAGDKPASEAGTRERVQEAGQGTRLGRPGLEEASWAQV